jgi:hypothetical protein
MEFSVRVALVEGAAACRLNSMLFTDPAPQPRNIFRKNFFQPGISHSPFGIYQPKVKTQKITSKLRRNGVGLFLSFRHERIR